MSVEERLRQGLHSAAYHVDVNPPVWTGERRATVGMLPTRRAPRRWPIAIAAAALAAVAGVALWALRPSSGIPAIDDQSTTATAPIAANQTTTTGAPITTAPVATAPVQTATTSPIPPAFTFPPDSAESRQPSAGSVALRDATSSLPALAPVAASLDTVQFSAVAGITPTLTVSATQVCIQGAASVVDAAAVCGTVGDVHFVEARIATTDKANAVEIIVLASDISVTSVDGSCEFVRAGTDAAKTLTVWICATTPGATVELNLGRPGAATITAYIQGQV